MRPNQRQIGVVSLYVDCRFVRLVAVTCNVPHPHPDGGAVTLIRQPLENASKAFVFAVLEEETSIGIVPISDRCE
jgi:hypothetical protein